MSRFPALLPLLSVDEAQSCTRIHSLAGLLSPNEPLMRTPPFRSPHQTASLEGICGGGIHCRPGEISLAHNGVLFLDEAAEFRTSVLQMLRVPIESGSVTLSRAGRTTIYPAQFQLLMAANPCPCGNFGSENKLCLCSMKSVEQYWRKFSGPLLDRVDIRVNVSECDEKQFIFKSDSQHPCERCCEQENCSECEKIFEENFAGEGEMTTMELRKGVANAVSIQRKRQGKKNARLTPEEILTFCALEKAEQDVLDCAVRTEDFSQRAISSILKVARTIADMEKSGTIQANHLTEAISFRKNGGIVGFLGE